MKKVKKRKTCYGCVTRELWEGISMKVKYGLCLLICGVVVGLGSLNSCSILKNYPADNIIEEYLEDIIEEKTGIDIDFTGEENLTQLSITT